MPALLRRARLATRDGQVGARVCRLYCDDGASGRVYSVTTRCVQHRCLPAALYNVSVTVCPTVMDGSGLEWPLQPVHIYKRPQGTLTDKKTKGINYSNPSIAHFLVDYQLLRLYDPAAVYDNC
jgi:hypothetical protein